MRRDARWILNTVVGALALATGLAAPSTEAAGPKVKTFSFHVGVNAAPPGTSLSELRYADDDAARFFRFTQLTATSAQVAVVLDSQSQERHPDVADVAIVPRTADLERALGLMHRQMAAARDAGERVEFIFSYSGHGSPGGAGTVLTALDGPLSPEWVEQWVLQAPADRVHMFVDACHGAGIVEKRGMTLSEEEGEAVDVSAAAQVVTQETMAAYPHVGVLIASPKGQSAHEWSRLEAGVFTHEVLSALAGAADINGDQKVAYSEVASFIAAANRKVKDPRARIRAITVAPQVNPRAPIVDLNAFDGGAVLEGRTNAFGHAWVETAGGVRLLDMHPMPQTFVRVVVPTDEPVYLITEKQEAKLEVRPRERVALADIKMVKRSQEVSARGSVAEALHDGLFRAPFERSYYRGFVDSEGMVAVSFSEAPDEWLEGERPLGGGGFDEGPGPWLVPGGLLAGAGVALAAAGGLGIFAGISFYVAENESLQRPARDAETTYYISLAAAVSTGVVGVGLGAAGALMLPIGEE